MVRDLRWADWTLALDARTPDGTVRETVPILAPWRPPEHDVAEDDTIVQAVAQQLPDRLAELGYTLADVVDGSVTMTCDEAPDEPHDEQ